MAISKDKKKEIVASFDSVVKDAESIVFVKFSSLNVADVNKLRRGLDQHGIGYKVGKKTLLKRVLDQKGFSGDMPDLPGEIAIAYGKDSIAPAREIYKFSKELKDAVSIVGGVFEGSYKSQSEMMAIATIPSIDVLRGMFVNVINSPIQRFAIALNEIAKTKSA